MASLSVPIFRLEVESFATKAVELASIVEALEATGVMEQHRASVHDRLGPFGFVLQLPVEKRAVRLHSRDKTKPEKTGEEHDSLRYTLQWKRVRQAGRRKSLSDAAPRVDKVEDAASLMAPPHAAVEAAKKYRESWDTQGSLLRFVENE